MTNQEKQLKLDVEKWLESEKQRKDQAGMMEWCYYCNNQKMEVDTKTLFCNSEKQTKYPCAQAHNKMVRNINKKNK